MKSRKAMVGTGAKRFSSKGTTNDKTSVEYREKRARNNDAVKKSRDKSKQKNIEASQRVKQLQMENENLKNIVENMQSELRYLKEMLINQAGASELLSSASEADLEYLLRDDTIAGPEDLAKLSTILTEMKRIQLQNSGIQQQNNSFAHYDAASNPYSSLDSTSVLFNQHPSGNC